MGTVESSVSLTGVVAISGFATELVTESAYPAISKTLASMIQGWSAENIKIVGSTLDSRSASSRRLSDFTQDFNFEVSFISEKAFGVDGRSYSNIESLADTLATTLSNKMASGQFETSLQLELSLSNVVSLSSSSTAELVSLQVSTVKYEGSDDLSVSTLPPVDYSSYTTTETISRYNVESIAVFFGVAIVGFVAFVGIMRQTATGNSYETLADESAHAMDVNESEMEDSTSPMVNSVFNIDSTPTTSLKL
jgi:hypothetical protein